MPADGTPAIDPWVVVERMDGGPTLVVENADAFAYAFFVTDLSSIGVAGFHNLAGKGVPNRITIDDVIGVNSSMRTRSRHAAWDLLTKSKKDLPWLVSIPPAFDLFAASDAAWRQVRPFAAEGLAAMVAPYRGLSTGSKVLHLKRPRLFPVLDSFVVQQVGLGSRSVIDVLDHLRAVGRANADALGLIAANLKDAGYVRSRVRILVSLLWMSHPATSLARSLPDWEHVIRFVAPPET
jgi:hypothetical protein